ncbi:hypothetical protein [Pantoea ananatis]|uniref:hypothetical protein n=1 Tax=Pantoea ananas TaxID=553 RepID=UPI000CF4C920|nr:hypothetical protein [Pantoea ananatis]PQL06119.1 hypothetical protein CG436_14905 [Pantoea ananatis]
MAREKAEWHAAPGVIYLHPLPKDDEPPDHRDTTNAIATKAAGQQTPSLQKPQVNKSRECLTAIHRIPSLFEIQYDAIAVFLTDSINQATRYLPTILL